jgi:hypothetical protein
MIIYNKGTSIFVKIICAEHGTLEITSQPLDKTIIVQEIGCPFCTTPCSVEPTVTKLIIEGGMIAIMAKIWIRRDRDGGKEEEVTEEFVVKKLSKVYANLRYAMLNCDEESPLSSGFADYWPKIEKGGSDNVKNKRS